MQHMRVETHIEAPVEEVWRSYCDPSNWPAFMPRGTYSDFTGPVDAVGTTYVAGVRIMGHEMRETHEIVEVEPQRLIHDHSDTGPMDNHWRFERDGDATNLVVESDYEMPGKVPGFIKDLVSKGWVERNFGNAMADFKALLEAEV
jgi:uncharacterized membrane protein